MSSQETASIDNFVHFLHCFSFTLSPKSNNQTPSRIIQFHNHAVVTFTTQIFDLKLFVQLEERLPMNHLFDIKQKNKTNKNFVTLNEKSTFLTNSLYQKTLNALTSFEAFADVFIAEV
jgi:hypothetical protein